MIVAHQNHNHFTSVKLWLKFVLTSAAPLCYFVFVCHISVIFPVVRDNKHGDCERTISGKYHAKVILAAGQ